MGENSSKNYWSNKNIQDAFIFFMLAIALMVYSLVNHYSTAKVEWKTSPYLFPLLISVFIGALSFSLLADGNRQIKLNEKNTDKAAIHWKDVLFTIGSAVVYYGLMGLLTFVPATILFLVAMFIYLGERRIWLIALISLISSLSIYIIFGVILHVMLP